MPDYFEEWRLAEEEVSRLNAEIRDIKAEIRDIKKKLIAAPVPSEVIAAPVPSEEGDEQDGE